RDIALEVIDLAERDASLELPLMLRAIDADVVDPRADHEPQHAAAVIEGPAVAGMHGGVDAVRPSDEVERWHGESHPAVRVETLRHQSFQIGIGAVNARAVDVIDADAEDKVVLRNAHLDVHLDRD